MAKNSADYKKGYDAAIKAIKAAQTGGDQSGNKAGNQGQNSGLSGVPGQDDSKQKGNQGQDKGDQQGSGGGNQSGKQKGSKLSNQPGGQGGSRSRNGKQSGQGVVRPEDCMPAGGTQGELGKTPSTAGGMISKAAGDELAKSEGFDSDGGSEDAIAKDWEKRAKEAGQKMAGKGAGYERLKAKFDGMYKVTKDWRKLLKNIVGRCINPRDARRAYANKNILVSQDRIARTDKDKYDTVDYMMAWIDTSGSMSQEDLNKCLNEVYGVANAKHPMKLVIIQFDTRIADIQEFRSPQELAKAMKNYELRGGGGTDVKDCFDLMAGKGKDKRFGNKSAELVLIFTDGYLEQYRRNNKTMKNLIWVIVDNPGFEIKYKDRNTQVVRLSSSDMGK